MSLADARSADVALAGWRPSPLTAKERAARARENDRHTFRRMKLAVEQALTRSQTVTRFDLQDFSEAEIARHFTKARRAARVQVDA